MAKVILGGNGIGVWSALGLLFIALKLTGNVTWSWFWTLCPFWLPLGIVFSALIFIGGVYLVGWTVDELKWRRKFGGIPRIKQ